jgi:hypothetical protein
MLRFMAIHNLPAGKFTKESLCQTVATTQHDENVRGYRSFFNLTRGKAVCVLEAHDRQSVVDWFRKMSIPYDEIIEVEYEGDHGSIVEVSELVGATS